MNNYCSIERNIQIVVSLLKANGIKKVIASPGATDIALNFSLQHDPWFEIYSEVDERNAAYMACGMAAESGEPVVITCTGATSSRNYMPGLTEAYYRQLPVLAITCSRSTALVGHYVDQQTDRSSPPKDTVKVSVNAQSVQSEIDEWDVMVKVNKAILGLTYNGGGPCHINLETNVESDFSVKEIPFVRTIKRFSMGDVFPEIEKGVIGIFVGAHLKWNEKLVAVVEKFCETYNAVVFCDHTSNYFGKYKVLFPLIYDQLASDKGENSVDLLIHIGNVSNCICKAKHIWRVNPDGEIRDTFKKLTCVFQMSEYDFFNSYTLHSSDKQNVLEKEYVDTYDRLYGQLNDIPFSNIWVAKQLAPKIPQNSVFHFGIRNSLRSWNYFKMPNGVLGFCNTGGFGIDGGISSLIGASFCDKNKLYYGVFGDLLFFYNMNSLGNRDISPNVRILIINNGLGQEFKNFGCCSSPFGEETNKFVAAEGHFGKKSKSLIRDYAKSLGFEYLTASSKEDFEKVKDLFLDPCERSKPILFEIFTESSSESVAFQETITLSQKSKLKFKMKSIIDKPQMNLLKSTIKTFIK